ncbi:MAG TPA: helix-turn-helix transcriptional regulator [Candidatus Tectomicrobia bacterium]|nr:helix-turn-helix transcriptional regulator [Candidatus Tectomicrobia bacterium]
MDAQAASRVRREIARLSHAGLDLAAFFRDAGRILRKAVPFEAACWHTLDPATLLETSHLVENLPLENPRAAEIEYLYDDYNQFVALARGPRTVGILREATGGVPERSRRYRELIRPLGLDAELRGAFVSGSAGWGAVGLLREPGSPPFSAAESRFLGSVSGYLAHGVRTALLLSAAAAPDAAERGPGLVLFDDRQRLEAMTPAADELLGELIDAPRTRSEPGMLPYVVHAVASRAALVARSGAPDAPARARVRTRAGRWLVLNGSVMAGAPSTRIAVIVEEAPPPTVAPLVAGAYGLSSREREVMVHMLRGSSTKEIADALRISAHTVQEHFKAIFDKVGVRSRRELVGRIFFRHFAGPVGADAPGRR